ncbi:aspartate--tRNA ligase [Phragmitibacter flavus]|uniref:Aspartate--tRNA(Asp/Asn) ligase n=1 Tax=Phragmitibacter flavus TaxID=2576071 RepID=A0A5R8KEI2_9BACT|nr:aspartate--tRNA ligase [Phragmitibacter flavus]TLD70385.1 aspartate--tRNA ligase [Phragmitibacter flavus]
MIANVYRTHHCNELRPDHIGETVTLTGWINTVRDQGGVIFVDLRDREGITQVVFRSEESPEAAALSHKLRDEDVLRVSGKVVQRLEGTANEKLATGAIEIVAQVAEVLNKAAVLPFQLDTELSNEDLRLKYRYLDLRRPRMNKNLRTRHRIVKATRDYLDEAGFVEVETPILSKSTPEGARDFLVPARLNPGKFYALPQAPQQYKQLLMVAGLEKYFQIARCFRDEDLRADRQPEFTQVDIEASFVTEEDIYALVEGLVASMFKAGRGVDIPTPFLRMTWKEAMDRFGSDKPDTRFGNEIVDLGDVFAKTEFKIFRGTFDKGGVVRAINAKGFACLTTGQMNRLNEIAIQAGLPVKTLAFIKCENGEYKSPLWKFFTEEEKAGLVAKMAIEEGDIVFFVAGEWESTSTILGRVRLEIADMQGITKDTEKLNFLWVIDFPLLGYSEEDGKWNAVHHPFTRPKAEDIPLLEAGEYAKVRAVAYDVVLNGTELGGGSLRIHESDLQAKMFEVLGVTGEEQHEMFGHILEAFQYGAPPHGGLALGLDRIIMLAAGEDSIREVIAFPKNNRGQELMTMSPGSVDFKQLRDLYVQSTFKPKEKVAETGVEGVK